MTTAIRFARDGGNVRRYHTTPIVGEQTNAHHTFNCLVLLDQLLSTVPRPLFRAVLYHDVSEAVAGDTPYMAKRRSPGLWQALHDLEAEVLAEHCLPDAEGLLPWMRDWFRLVDAAECCFFAIDQKALGNSRTDAFFWTGLRNVQALLDQPQGMVGGDKLLDLLAHLEAEATRLAISDPSPHTLT